jgi:hypothetical protein
LEYLKEKEDYYREKIERVKEMLTKSKDSRNPFKAVRYEQKLDKLYERLEDSVYNIRRFER